MDDLGNRSNVALRSGTNQAYTVDNLTNKYTAIASVNQTYDNAGNLTADYHGYLYTYDYENRLIKVSNSSIDLVTYSYDALGRRIVKNDLVDSSSSRRYYYNDNWQVTCEYDATETTPILFVYGNYIDEVIAKIGNGVPVYYLSDHLYSPAVLCYSVTGAVLERYEYDAYGKPVIYAADYTTRTASSYKNPYLFTGRNVDFLDGGNLKLQYNRNRYYDYDIGRWLTKDPLGVVPNAMKPNKFKVKNEYQDGMNLYQYVACNPINHKDSLGLFFDYIRSPYKDISNFLKGVCDKYKCCRSCTQDKCRIEADILARKYYAKLTKWIKERDDNPPEESGRRWPWGGTYNFCYDYADAIMAMNLNSGMSCFNLKKSTDTINFDGHAYVGVFHTCNKTNHSDINLDPWSLSDVAHCPKVEPGTGGDIWE